MDNDEHTTITYLTPLTGLSSVLCTTACRCPAGHWPAINTSTSVSLAPSKYQR